MNPGKPRAPLRNAALWILFVLCLGVTAWSFAAMVRTYPEHVAAMTSE